MEKRIKNRYVGLAVIVIGIITLHYIGALNPIERLWVNLITPPASSSTSITKSILFWHGWKDKKLLEEEIFLLRSRLQRNESSIARLKALEKENKELKDAIGWNETKPINIVIGKIIGKPINYPSSYVILNRGKVDGLIIGQPVFINEDILIGKVVTIQADTSIIQLITDNQSFFSVRKSDGDEAIGLVSGKLGLSLEISFVLSNEVLVPGDILVTSGLDSLIPEGLVIGSVNEVQADENDFFQSGSLSLSYNPNEISIVSILLSR